MNKKQQKSHGAKDLLRRFSTEVLRNARMIRVRFDISSLMKSREQKFRDLGIRTYRLLRRGDLEHPDLKRLRADLDDLNAHIEEKEGLLRNIILEGRVPDTHLLGTGATPVSPPAPPPQSPPPPPAPPKEPAAPATQAPIVTPESEVPDIERSEDEIAIISDLPTTAAATPEPLRVESDAVEPEQPGTAPESELELASMTPCIEEAPVAAEELLPSDDEPPPVEDQVAAEEEQLTVVEEQLAAVEEQLAAVNHELTALDQSEAAQPQIETSDAATELLAVSGELPALPAEPEITCIEDSGVESAAPEDEELKPPLASDAEDDAESNGDAAETEPEETGPLVMVKEKSPARSSAKTPSASPSAKSKSKSKKKRKR